jgi:hypothetical protein
MVATRRVPLELAQLQAGTAAESKEEHQAGNPCRLPPLRGGSMIPYMGWRRHAFHVSLLFLFNMPFRGRTIDDAGDSDLLASWPRLEFVGWILQAGGPGVSECRTSRTGAARLLKKDGTCQVESQLR